MSENFGEPCCDDYESIPWWEKVSYADIEAWDKAAAEVRRAACGKEES